MPYSWRYVTERYSSEEKLTDTAQARFLEAAQAVKAGGVLGRSRLLVSLFDYLVSRSVDGRPPKESEIAYDVFAKSGAFETGQDAVVRVYVHRLRRKLQDYAAEADGVFGFHLTLPKGEYRIVKEAPPVVQAEAVRPTIPTSPARGIGRRWFAAALALLIVLNVGAWAVFVHPADPLTLARRSPIWAPLAASKRPLLLVVGDYFIFGDSDDGMEVTRLVREYEVNSSSQLSQFLMNHPDKAGRYLDLGLTYLPTSAGPAIADIAPLFANSRPIRVITMTQLTPEMMKTYDVIYIGYLSGLGKLEVPALSGSSFEIGDSFDEIRDRVTLKRYLSQAGYGPAQGDVYRDFGYVAVFPGPNGNHIVVISGTRDIGVMAAAEQMSQPDALDALRKTIGSSDNFEALYEVTGQGEVNFQTRLLKVVPRRPANEWATLD